MKRPRQAKFSTSPQIGVLFMARSPEEYLPDHEWRGGPQGAFWKALESTVPNVWAELDALAKRWAEDMPWTKVESRKISYYAGVEGTRWMHECFFPSEIHTKQGVVEQTFVEGGGSLTPEFRAARAKWQHTYGLDAIWLSELADLFILKAYTGIELLTTNIYGVVGREPTLEIGDSPADYGRRATDHYRTVIAPFYGRSRVRTLKSPHHLEWTAIYQCGRLSFADIADRYAAKLGRENLDARSVEGAVKAAAETIQLPLRPLPRGRKPSVA